MGNRYEKKNSLNSLEMANKKYAWRWLQGVVMISQICNSFVFFLDIKPWDWIDRFEKFDTRQGLGMQYKDEK